MSLHLPDGTSWPAPCGDLEHTLRYGEPTRTDLLNAAGVLSAYNHLATHPAGTEAVVKQLRMLRRAVRKSDG